MTDRPILRLNNPTKMAPRTGTRRIVPGPSGPGSRQQATKFANTFSRLDNAFAQASPAEVLRSDPTGIAPERAMVFVVAGSFAKFAQLARKTGLELVGELDIDPLDDAPDGFTAADANKPFELTLYATIPTLEAFETLRKNWEAYKRKGSFELGYTGWRDVFDLLIDLRPWGPQDRLDHFSIQEIRERLPLSDEDPVKLEFEIWPSANKRQRDSWQTAAAERIRSLDGQIVHTSSIAEPGFIYEAILAELPAGAVRHMIDDTHQLGGLADLEGVQFIKAQSVAQSLPSADTDLTAAEPTALEPFTADAPQRAVLLDGTPVAAHPALNGGVSIEDLHGYVSQTVVSNRKHATAMASLILRGDLAADRNPLKDTRLLSVPVLIDTSHGATSNDAVLFVDLIHTTLVRLFTGTEPLAPDAFVVNFSIGITDHAYANKIHSLARLLDWWSEHYGILFVISAGNNSGHLKLLNMSTTDFEGLDQVAKRKEVFAELISLASQRSLLAPAEAMNGLTVGAASRDLVDHTVHNDYSRHTLNENTEAFPQVSSCLGLGHKQAIKPDLLQTGGLQEITAMPSSNDVRISISKFIKRTGLVVAGASETGGTVHSGGSSDAAALTTRTLLKAAEALTSANGPYAGQELPRRQLALLTKAMAIHASKWPEGVNEIKEISKTQNGASDHARARSDALRFYGNGVLDESMVLESPANGATVVGYGTVKKDSALIFKLPKPASMANVKKLPRSMRVTLAWFTPTNPSRAQYRLAGLEAVCAENQHTSVDKGWGLSMTSGNGPDVHALKRGSVFSRRLKHATQKTPDFDEDEYIPIYVQCRDTAGGGLNPDDEIEFAIVVTLENEVETEFDIYEEIRQAIQTSVTVGS